MSVRGEPDVSAFITQYGESEVAIDPRRESRAA